MAPPLIHAAALALRAAATVCPVSPACPRDNGCALTENGVTLQVSCGTDYYGGDLQRSQASTLAGCIRDCSLTTGCVAASYVGNNCYIKNTRNAGHTDANVIGIAVTAGKQNLPASAGQQICPASFTCPENDGCSYTAESRTLRLSWGVDFYGGDINSQFTESLQACTQTCAADAKCIAASFVGGKGSGRCYLKSAKNVADFNDNVNAVYVVPSTSATPTPYAFTTCESINSGVNLVSNPSFETNSENGRPAQGWVSGSTDVYGVNYQRAAHCGTAYMVFRNGGQSAVSTLAQKISTALDMSKSYTVTLSFWPYEGDNRSGCSLNVYANDKRVLRRDVTNFPPVTPEDTPSYETHTSSSFIPATSDVTIRVEYTCTASGTSYILFDDVGLAPDQVSP